MSLNPTPRVSPIHAPDRYILPGRPEAAAGPVADAFRQVQFLLGPDLDLFARSMGLQLQLVRDAYPSRYRTHELAAVMGLWSRVYCYLSDSLLLVTRASYASTPPLLRAACEAIAAQRGLLSGEMGEHHQWLAETMRPNEDFKAFEFALGLYFAGSAIADDPVLTAIYRPASDLARPNFGATLLQVGPESNNQRLALSFADAGFHLGWAELLTGWLLALSGRQLQVVVGAPAVFPVSDEAKSAYDDLVAAIDALLARGDRCRLEEVMDGNDRRYLVHNFRRASGAAPKKVLL